MLGSRNHSAMVYSRYRLVMEKHCGKHSLTGKGKDIAVTRTGKPLSGFFLHGNISPVHVHGIHKEQSHL